MPRSPSEATAPLPLSTRLWFAWVCFFRVLFDGVFAGGAFRVYTGQPALPPGELEPRALPAKEEAAQAPDRDRREARKRAGREERPEKAEAAEAAEAPAKTKAAKAPPLEEAPDPSPALQLLALLQREGRLVDFLEQEIASFPDAEIGAAVRVVHEGCRKALHDHVRLAPVRAEEEGARVTLAAGFDAAAVKLTGNVHGKGPFHGVLRHRGWRVAEVTLPRAVSGHDARTIAPAEVEVG